MSLLKHKPINIQVNLLDESVLSTILILLIGIFTVVCEWELSQTGNISEDSFVIPKSTDCRSKLQSLSMYL